MEQCNHEQRVLDVIRKLEETLPAIIARKSVSTLLGGAIAAGTLANLGKKGPQYFYIGRQAVYEKSEFLTWLKANISFPP